MEPNLEIEIRCGSLGQVAVKIMVTPDHMTQSQEFKFDLDQSYLGPFIDGCKSVLSRWPVRAETSAYGHSRHLCFVPVRRTSACLLTKAE